jgi:hypothetical protein
MTDLTEASRAVLAVEPSPRALIDAQVRQTVTERGVTNFPRGDILVAWAILQLADRLAAIEAKLSAS